MSTSPLLDTAAETNEWRPVTPDIAEKTIDQMVGEHQARAKVTTLAGNLFDAENSSVEASAVLERIHRKEARLEGNRRARIAKDQKQHPEVQYMETAEKLARKPMYQYVTGLLALIAMGVLLAPIPVVIAQGIAWSFAFDAISDDFRLGLPFGVPALGGIFAAGLLRQVCGEYGRKAYDRIVGLGVVLALGAWAGAYAYTFLAPAGGSGGFGDAGGVTDLRIYYAAHLALEVAAGLGLAAMVERAFETGRRRIGIVDQIKELLGKRGAFSIARMLRHLVLSETCADRRARLKAARAAYVEASLAYLNHAEARQKAAIAAASVHF